MFVSCSRRLVLQPYHCLCESSARKHQVSESSYLGPTAFCDSPESSTGVLWDESGRVVASLDRKRLGRAIAFIGLGLGREFRRTHRLGSECLVQSELLPNYNHPGVDSGTEIGDELPDPF
jgi:hypothetical protein